MSAAFRALGAAGAIVFLASSCTALLGLNDKQFGGGSGGATSSSTVHSTSSSAPSGVGGTTSSTASLGAGGGPSTSSSGAGGTPTCPGADLMNDPFNCGRCNHDCLGGMCMAGACQPVSVVSGTFVVPQLLAIDQNWVYYATAVGNKNLLMFRGVHDMPNATAAPLGQIDNATNLAAAGGYVGWVTSTPVDGSTAAAAYFQKAQAMPTPMSLYMGSGEIGPMIGHGQYFSFVASSLNLVTDIPLGAQHVVAETNVVEGLAADPAHVYAAFAGGAITAGDPFGMTPQVLTTDLGARLLATSDTDPNLYWIIPNAQTPLIRMAPKTGGAPVTIGNPTLLAPQSLAVDAVAVYAASLPGSCPGQTQNGQIQRIDLVTHTETLLPGAVCPFIVVADDVCIYWTDPNAGGLMRLAK
jgi:hypothetical protein